MIRDSVVPEFMQESVATWRQKKLTDWPDFEARFGGNGAAKHSREVVDQKPPDVPFHVNPKPFGSKTIGPPPSHDRPGMKRKTKLKGCKHEETVAHASYYEKKRERCIACGAVLWAVEDE